MPALLFVCTGNTCRSPMAEALFKRRLADAHLPGWQVESAGTWAAEGQPAAREAVAAMAQRGIDLTHHRAQLVTGTFLNRFNLILTMESGHREALLAEFPHLAGRVCLLSEMIGRNFNIADPIGSPQLEYEHTAQQIDQILQRGWAEIMSRTVSNKKMT
jgi:protein-tyrosine-phosphatase